MYIYMYIYIYTRLAAFDVFHMFTQSIKFHCRTKNIRELLTTLIVQMFEKRDSSIDSKNGFSLYITYFCFNFIPLSTHRSC